MTHNQELHLWNGYETPPRRGAAVETSLRITERQAVEESLHGDGSEVRRFTTLQQLTVLRVAYAQNPTPARTTRKSIAKKVGMSEKSVRIWFQSQPQRRNGRKKKHSVQQQNEVAQAQLDINSVGLADAAIDAPQDGPIDSSCIAPFLLSDADSTNTILQDLLDSGSSSSMDSCWVKQRSESESSYCDELQASDTACNLPIWTQELEDYASGIDIRCNPGNARMSSSSPSDILDSLNWFEAYLNSSPC